MTSVRARRRAIGEVHLSEDEVREAFERLMERFRTGRDDPVGGMIATLLTMSVPNYTGPTAEALDFTDPSWLVGPLVALAIFIPWDRAGRLTMGVGP